MLGNILLAHNGTIDNYWKAIKVDQNKVKDTEAFLMLMAGYTGLDSVEGAFTHAIEDIKKNCLYSALNMIFSDGLKLYTYRSFTTQPDYHTIFRTMTGSSTVYCSEQISAALKWDLLDADKLYSA